MTSENQNSMNLLRQVDASGEQLSELMQSIVSASVQGFIYLLSGVAIAVNLFGTHFLD